MEFRDTFVLHERVSEPGDSQSSQSHSRSIQYLIIVPLHLPWYSFSVPFLSEEESVNHVSGMICRLFLGKDRNRQGEDDEDSAEVASLLRVFFFPIAGVFCNLRHCPGPKSTSKPERWLLQGP